LEERPALVLMSRFNDLASLEEHLRLRQRSDERFGYDGDKLLMYAVDADRLLRPHAGPGHADPSLAWTAEKGTIDLTIRPAIQADARVTVTVKAKERFDYTVRMEGRKERYQGRPAGEVQLLTFKIDREDLKLGRENHIQVEVPEGTEARDVALELSPRGHGG
jgi:hypothetical protein